MTAGPPVPAPGDDWFHHADGAPDNIDVGEFAQGSPFSRWALARYLVGRAVTESIGWSLLGLGVVVLALAALSFWVVHSTALGVLLVIVGFGVLVFRWLLLGIVRRLTGFRHYGPLEDRMSALVGDTSSDVLRELRRIGLPGRLWTLPLLAVRLLRRRRRGDTVDRLRRFEVERAVPKARLDELHLVLRTALGNGPVAGSVDGPAA